MKYFLFLLIAVLFSCNNRITDPIDSDPIQTLTLDFTEEFDVNTLPLKKNTNYVFKISGTYGYARNTDELDAAYRFINPSTGEKYEESQIWGYYFIDGTMSYLNVIGEYGEDVFPKSTDSYNEDHVYNFNFVGEDKPVNFKFLDDHLVNNSGFLTVEIFEK